MVLTKNFKNFIKNDCLGLEEDPKIKPPIALKSGNFAIPVILDNQKEVYFLCNNEQVLISQWYYEKENILFNN